MLHFLEGALQGVGPDPVHVRRELFSLGGGHIHEVLPAFEYGVVSPEQYR